MPAPFAVPIAYTTGRGLLRFLWDRSSSHRWGIGYSSGTVVGFHTTSFIFENRRNRTIRPYRLSRL